MLQNQHTANQSIRPLLKAVGIAAALLLFTIVPAPTAQAQPEPQVPAVNNEPAAVPDWVVPGARITQYSMSSHTPTRNRGRERERQRRHAREREADRNNDRLSEEDRMRRERARQATREQGIRDDTRGSAGGGYNQFDIVAVTDNAVLIEMRIFSEADPGQPAELASVTALSYDRATGGGLWMSTDTIANTPVTTDTNANTQVFKGPYEVGEHTYNAIMFDYRDGENHRVMIYDQETGIQLYQSELSNDDSGRTHGSAELRGYRVAELPWHGTEMSEQVQALQRLTFEGDIIYRVPNAGEIPDTRFPIEIVYEVKEAGERIAVVESTTEIDLPGRRDQRIESRDVITSTQRGGLWIDPATLAQLETDQLLDEDPTLGYTIRVTEVYEVQGITMVEITEAGRGNSYSVVKTYDASVGLMVAMVVTQPSLNQVVEITLQRVE